MPPNPFARANTSIAPTTSAVSLWPQAGQVWLAWRVRACGREFILSCGSSIDAPTPRRLDALPEKHTGGVCLLCDLIETKIRLVAGTWILFIYDQDKFPI